ncbi:MAG TPA: aspartate aminotransferase family protein [Acidisphaera sp.]|nr:aspartate aminotransferase family protein [Acidisphaera sp.]
MKFAPAPDDPIAVSAEWESSARSYVRAFPAVFARAQGPWLIDTAGRRYLDFLTGAGVMVLGHNHPAVRAAVATDPDPVTNGLDLLTTAKLAFVERLRTILPGDMAATHKLHFCGPTGSDCVEAALKLASIATGRRGVIAFAGGYHGMTQGALSVSSSRRLREVGLLGPAAVDFCPYPYPLRFPAPYRTPEAATAFCLANLQLMLEDPHSGIGRPGMLLLEAVQGEGGTVVAPPAFLTAVAELCRRHGILLAVDEVQSAMGRTGRWFAFEYAGIEPDIVCLSKGVGGGYPLSLLLFHRRLDVWQPGDHIGTFRGQQIAMTAGRATIDFIVAAGLLANATQTGTLLLERLSLLTAGHPAIAEVRGLGLMLGAEMAESGGADAGAVAARLQAALFAEGVVVEVGGRGGAVIRLLPPLTIGVDEVSLFLAAFSRALGAL